MKVKWNLWCLTFQQIYCFASSVSGSSILLEREVSYGSQLVSQYISKAPVHKSPAPRPLNKQISFQQLSEDWRRQWRITDGRRMAVPDTRSGNVGLLWILPDFWQQISCQKNIPIILSVNFYPWIDEVNASSCKHWHRNGSHDRLRINVQRVYREDYQQQCSFYLHQQRLKRDHFECVLALLQ